MTDRLYHDAELVQFYDFQNTWGDDFTYCQALAADACSVLDLGCGTGEFLATISEGRRTVGVDPAPAMLDVARARAGGEGVTWLEGDARTIRLDQHFDLIILTGHAFQVFLNKDDQRAVLATIAAHLAPQGQFIFDSRNPVRAAWRHWMRDQPGSKWAVDDHPTLGAIEAWGDARQDSSTGVVTYETHYRVKATGQHLSAQSRILFTAKADLAEMIDGAGLGVDQWMGDWQGSEFNESSDDIIPRGGLR